MFPLNRLDKVAFPPPSNMGNPEEHERIRQAALSAKKALRRSGRGGKKYFWCACGRSKNQPFCDGSHAGTVFRPIQFGAEKNETVNFCGCKATKNRPRCDGTHNKI